MEKSRGGRRTHEYFKQEYWAFNPTSHKAASYHELITRETDVRLVFDIDHADATTFTRFLQVVRQLFEESYNTPIRIRYIYNEYSRGYHVYTNVCVSHLQFARFFADRVNVIMGS